MRNYTTDCYVPTILVLLVLSLESIQFDLSVDYIYSTRYGVEDACSIAAERDSPV